MSASARDPFDFPARFGFEARPDRIPFEGAPAARLRRLRNTSCRWTRPSTRKSIEPRISAAWDREGAFRAGRPDRAGREKYTIVIPPPNVTGSLHMGHALNNTLQDILCRFERMRGKDVLWQPGTDHAASRLRWWWNESSPPSATSRAAT